MLNKKPPSHDQHGQCLHLYLTRDATCVHCGMVFKLAWQAERGWLTRPAVRNIVMGSISAAFLLVGTLGSIAPILTAVFLVGTVLFFTRALLGGLEMFARHGFVPGVLGALIQRRRYNLLAAKPYSAVVGRVKFPFDATVYGQFQPGDTLLVEHLRWSRLPVAIYRGHLDP
jgi:hypothetical protein